MPAAVKICGLTTQEAVDAAVEHGAAYIGFVFFPKSPRNVSPEQAAALTQNLKGGVKKVAVVVNPTDEDLEDIIMHFKPDFIQLHGEESPERCNAIQLETNIPIIKAIKVKHADDIAEAASYDTDMVLFDAQPDEGAELPGGNGMRFDWELLKGRDFGKTWILSGGLNTENVAEAIEVTEAPIVDVSSSIEIEPGIKDPDLIKAFIDAAKSAS